MTKLTIRFLGECQFIYDGQVVSGLQTKRLRSLLGFLLLHAGQQISATQLAFLFWPDSSEKQARTNLRGLFYSLRNAFPQYETYLDRSDHTVTWRIDSGYELDVNRFEACLETAQRSIQSERVRLAQGALEEAISLYRGDLLPDCYDDWILVHRERLRQHYLGAVEQLMDLLERESDYSAAIRYGEVLLREDSLREQPYRSLMQLHALRGDRANALRVYHACVSELERELGVEPHAQTTALYRRLLRADDLAADRGAEAEHVAESSQLVGRQAERRQLFSAWRRAAAGEVTFVLIQGEAGIGKTRLAEELYSWASHLGIDTARSSTYAASTGLAYAPVLDWLRSGALAQRLAELDPIWRSELVRLLPDILINYPETPRPAPLAEEWQRLRFFEALARVVCAGNEPTLLWIDDLQWCDGETLAWLQYLVQYKPQAPLLLLGTARDETLSPEHPLAALTHHLRRIDLLIEIGLDRLNVEEAALLSRQIAGGSLQPGDAERLALDAGGNPLFIVEMARAGLQLGAVDVEALVGEVGEGGPAVSLPPKVHSVIQSRLAQLSPAASTLAALASTIGKPFTFDLLKQASELDEDQLVQRLDELWRRRIVREQGIDSADDTYDFSHDRIRDVAYGQLSSIRRRFFHRAVAAALETTYADRGDEWSAELARHHEQAGNRTAAASYYRRAGERAAAQFAQSDAIDYFSRALALSGEDDPAARFVLLGLRERTYHLHAARDLQEADLASMMDLADGLEDDGRRAMVLLRRAERAEGQGDYGIAVALAEQAVDLAQAIGNRLLEAQGVIRLGSAYWNWGDYGRSEQVYHNGLDIVRAIGEQGLETTVLLHLGALNVYYAPYAEALHICRQALAAAARVGDVEGEIWARNQLGFLIVEQGNEAYDDAEVHLTAGLNLARKIGSRSYMAKLSSNLSRLYDRSGDAPKALACLQESLAIAETTGATRHRAFALNFRGNVLANQGELDAANEDLLEALDLFETIGYRQGEGKTLSDLALLSTAQGAFQGALERSSAALAIAEEIGIRRDQAYALTRKGYALEGMQRWREAAAAYKEAFSIYAKTEQEKRSLEPMAGLTRIAHATGAFQQALSHLNPILAHLLANRLDVVLETRWVYQTCWQILNAAGDARAADIQAIADEMFVLRDQNHADFLQFSPKETLPTHFGTLLERRPR